MTKRHFIRAAEKIRLMPDGPEKTTCYKFFRDLGMEFNPRFDVDKFREACGL